MNIDPRKTKPSDRPDVSWELGYIVSIIIGIGMWAEYNAIVGITVAFVLVFLVDIRYEVTCIKDFLKKG